METQISHLCDTGSTREERKRITFIMVDRLYLWAHKALIINICRPRATMEVHIPYVQRVQVKTEDTTWQT